MGDNGKKFQLNLPLKVILSDGGTSHFLGHNINLTRFHMADGKDEKGISINPFSPKSVQDMVMLDYISKIEVSMAELTAFRQDVMDLSKTIVYSLLYKQFDRVLYSTLVKCDVVVKFNRANPRSLIDESTKIPDAKLRPILEKKKTVVALAKKSILEPVWKAIMTNQSYSPEERNVYILMSEKFLNRLGLMNWHVITQFFQKEGFEQINLSIRHLLQEYMEKSSIADHISLLLMELVTNNENTNLRKVAKILYNGIEDTDSVVLNPEIREKLFAELKNRHELVTISWQLGGGSAAIGKQGRLHIMLFNKDDQYQLMKDTVSDKMSNDTKKRSIVDFYRDEPNASSGMDLGMMYFSYLDESCKKANVKFESIVNQPMSNDLTVINLIFNF